MILFFIFLLLVKFSIFLLYITKINEISILSYVDAFFCDKLGVKLQQGKLYGHDSGDSFILFVNQKS